MQQNGLDSVRGRPWGVGAGDTNMSNEKTQTTPRIETPKTETKATGGGFTPPFMAFEPMQVWTIGQQAWQSTQQAWAASQEVFQKMIGDAFGGSQAFAEQFAQAEAQM